MRVIVYQASDTSALSKNFTRKDFKCPCGYNDGRKSYRKDAL